MVMLNRDIFLVFLACFMVVSCTRHAIPESAQKEASESFISDKDRAELIRLELELEVTGKESIILSTENIEPHLVPEFDGVEIVLLTPEEIEEKRRAEGSLSFRYFRFHAMGVKSADSVFVTLEYLPALAEHEGGLIGMSGHRSLWVREDGVWRRAPGTVYWQD